MSESPVLVHVWEIDPAEEAAAVHSLNEMFREIVKDPGFVSARVSRRPTRPRSRPWLKCEARRTANVLSSFPAFTSPCISCMAPRIC